MVYPHSALFCLIVSLSVFAWVLLILLSVFTQWQLSLWPEGSRSGLLAS